MRKQLPTTRILVSILLFLLAIPIGLWFLLHDNPFPFNKLKHLWGFWLSWGLSTGIAYLAMTLVEYGTRLLIQFAAGFLIPLAVVVAWNAGVFYGRDTATNLEPYFDSEFWLTLILLLVFNGLCCVVLVLWKAHFGRTVIKVGNDAAKQKGSSDVDLDIAHILSVCAYIEVVGRQCKVHRMDGGHEWYGVTMERMGKLLAGPHCCQIFRMHIVARQAIAEIDHHSRKRKCRVKLKAPYADVTLVVGQHYQKDFLKWLES